MRRKKLPLHEMWIRGSIGKEFVIKHTPWGIIKTKFPDMSRIIASAQQRKCRNLFAEAVVYAKKIIADPVVKREWQKRIKHRNGVYNKAIKSFMLRERCIRDREALLLAQQLRVAAKNEMRIKRYCEAEPMQSILPGRVVARYCYMETG